MIEDLLYKQRYLLILIFKRKFDDKKTLSIMESFYESASLIV